MNETLEQGGQDPDGARTPPVDEPTPQPAPQRPADDGFPGGPTPESSGFSWRLPGSAPAVMHSQGGIPNEFDHLFRDSDADRRHSLMPSQGQIGVSVPSAQGGPAALPPGRPAAQPPAQPPAPNGAEPPLPAYQTPGQQQPGLAAYPQQPYVEQTYQGSYGQTTQVPVGAPSDDHRNTQAIPRVPVQPYAYAPQQGSQGGGAMYGPGGAAAGGGERRTNTTLLASVAIFVILIVVAAVMLSGGGDKSSSSTAKQGGGGTTATGGATGTAAPVKNPQADALLQLMESGTKERDAASTAISDVGACKNQGDAVTTFKAAQAKRQSQSDGVKALPIDQLPAGAKDLVENLKNGFQYSADSEKELAAWATDNATCTGAPTKNDNRHAADADGGKAGSYKGTAVSEWNAMAAQMGEPTITTGDL